jgi:hypothetical protein
VACRSQVCVEYLEDLGQFGGKSALWFLFALSAAAAFRWPAIAEAVGSLHWRSLFRSGGRADGTRGFVDRDRSAFGGLCRVGSKNFVFQRGSVETADNRLHLVRSRSLDKRKSLGFLRLVVPDNFDRIRDKVFGREPLLNIVRGDPYG